MSVASSPLVTVSPLKRQGSMTTNDEASSRSPLNKESADMSRQTTESSSSFDGGSTSSENCEPSTSQDYSKDQNSSPALAQSVPTSHEATSPTEAAGGIQPQQPQEIEYVYFTTEMANQAAIDIEREKDKFDTLLKWMSHQREKEEAAAAALGTSRGNSTHSVQAPSESGDTTKENKENRPSSSQPASHQSTSANDGLMQSSSGFNGFPYSPHFSTLGCGGPGSTGPKIEKDELVSLDDITPSRFDTVEDTPKSNLKRKYDEPENGMMSNMKVPKIEEQEIEHADPLRRLEMMSAAKHFSSPNTLSDVVEAAKKDDRTAKLEKLDEIEKCVKKMAAGQAFPSPGQFPGGMPPGYPGGHPGMHGYPGPMGPYSVGAFPPQPGAPPQGPYPPHYGYPYPHGMPPGYPMSAPPGNKMAYPSPSYQGPPMSGPPGRMPGMPMHPSMMNPQHPYFAQMQAQHMAQMASKEAMSPGGSMMPGAKASPAGSPFPPGHPIHPMYHQHQHQMMMMRQGMPHGPFVPYGPSPGMMPGQPPHPGMPGMPGMPGQPPHPGMLGMPPGMMHPAHNSTLLVARNGGQPCEMGGPGMGMGPGMGPASAWAPQLTPCYPPAFPAPIGTPVTRVNSNSSAMATPGK